MKCCYCVVNSELNRYCKLSSKFSEFKLRKESLFEKLTKKGYSRVKLDSILDSLRINFSIS